MERLARGAGNVLGRVSGGVSDLVKILGGVVVVGSSVYMSGCEVTETNKRSGGDEALLGIALMGLGASASGSGNLNRIRAGAAAQQIGGGLVQYGSAKAGRSEVTVNVNGNSDQNQNQINNNGDRGEAGVQNNYGKNNIYGTPAQIDSGRGIPRNRDFSGKLNLLWDKNGNDCVDDDSEPRQLSGNQVSINNFDEILLLRTGFINGYGGKKLDFRLISSEGFALIVDEEFVDKNYQFMDIVPISIKKFREGKISGGCIARWSVEGRTVEEYPIKFVE